MSDMHRTPAYWPTRIMLAVGIVATSLTVAFAFWFGFLSEGLMFGPETNLLGVPIRAIAAVAAAVLSVVGLVWMVRILRGPGDKPSRWRYRDR
jgi:hypothetical protein